MATKDISDAQVMEAYKRYEERPHLPGNHPMVELSYAFSERPLVDKFPNDYLAEITAQPMKVCWRAMERAERRGLLEVGVSLRTAWATEKGKALYFSQKQPA